jgi:hypothetical protein
MKMAIQDLNSPEGMCREKTGDRKGELSETGSDILFLVFINPSLNIIFFNSDDFQV